tara:strand:+ start:1206 stop:2009 length:804 start_codon:yes stop_codon:yes gene_type:complete
MIVEPVIEKISNDLDVVGNTTVTGNLTVTGDYIGLPEVEGLPTPLGEEGMVLSIMDGKPTWVFFEPPEPPPPENYVGLVDERDATPTGIIDYGVRTESGSVAYPAETWDEYIRTLPTWEAPTKGSFGLAGTGADDRYQYELNLPFKLDLSGNHGKVLQVSCAWGWEQSYADPGTTTLELTTTQEYLTPVTVSASDTVWKADKLVTLSFLVTRPDLGVCDFNLKATVPDKGYPTKITYCSVQSFQCVDNTRLLLELLKERALGLAEPR